MGTASNTEKNIPYAAKMQEYTVMINWETPTHRHSFWEIIICTHGAGYHTINGKKYDFSVGDMIVMKPESTHTNVIFDFKEYIHLDFYVKLNVMMQACDEIHPNIHEQLIKSKEPICLKLDEGLLKFLEFKLTHLYSIQKNRENSDITQAIYNTVLHLLCGLIVEKKLVDAKPAPNPISDLLVKMSHPEVLTNSIDYVVKISNYSHGYLCKLFKKHTGERLIDYFTKLKMEYAAQLMRNSRLKILEISSMLGYTSLSHFIALFKRITGLTPKQYRKHLVSLTDGFLQTSLKDADMLIEHKKHKNPDSDTK